jgi:phospholipase/carboxylesterase
MTNMLYHLVRMPTTATVVSPLLILLHGVGSNEGDLFRFTPDIDERFLVLSPRAPLTLQAGSYAWFQVDFSTGQPVIVSEEAEASRHQLVKFIDEVVAQYSADAQQVYLLGFSQGAIMSASVALTAPEKVAGIVMLSGRILPEIKPLIAENSRLKHLHVFLSHGVHDNKLPLFHAEASRALLSQLPVRLEYHTYDMGHTITAQSLSEANLWLQQRLEGESA